MLEIGCANGKDAMHILARTNEYVGIDISPEFIRLAQQKVPGATFKVGDVERFEFPSDLDVIFAFASLIHLPKESLQGVFSKAS